MSSNDQFRANPRVHAFDFRASYVHTQTNSVAKRKRSRKRPYKGDNMCIQCCMAAGYFSLAAALATSKVIAPTSVGSIPDSICCLRMTIEKSKSIRSESMTFCLFTLIVVDVLIEWKQATSG